MVKNKNAESLGAVHTHTHTHTHTLTHTHTSCVSNNQRN